MPKSLLTAQSLRFPLFMTAKESCDAFGVEISRRNRLVQNAKKIPRLIMYTRQKKLHTHYISMKGQPK